MKKINPNLLFRKPEAVLFDTDNTLYDYDPANKLAEEAVCKKAENLLGLSRKDFFHYYKIAKKEIKSNIPNTASSHSRLLYFQRMIEILGYKAHLLLALDFEQTFWRNFLINAPLFNGIRETLLFLKENKIPIAVVTDLTAQRQLRKLTYFGLEDTFDAVVTSEEVGVDKPDLRNFKLALHKLNLSNKSLFWMIGDNANADIFGAKQLNAVTFQKVNPKINFVNSNLIADYTFDDYFLFLKKIKTFFKNKRFD